MIYAGCVLFEKVDNPLSHFIGHVSPSTVGNIRAIPNPSRLQEVSRYQHYCYEDNFISQCMFYLFYLFILTNLRLGVTCSHSAERHHSCLLSEVRLSGPSVPRIDKRTPEFAPRKGANA
jgi:hypothetical protein